MYRGKAYHRYAIHTRATPLNGLHVEEDDSLAVGRVADTIARPSQKARGTFTPKVRSSVPGYASRPRPKHQSLMYYTPMFRPVSAVRSKPKIESDPSESDPSRMSSKTEGHRVPILSSLARELKKLYFLDA